MKLWDGAVSPKKTATVNQYLAQHPWIDTRMDHRSNAARGLDEQPTVHEGYHAQKPADAVKNTIPVLAEAMENLHKCMLLFICQRLRTSRQISALVFIQRRLCSIYGSLARPLVLLGNFRIGVRKLIVPSPCIWYNKIVEFYDGGTPSWPSRMKWI